MYLKRLELVGFKSFAERTELEFGPGLTAVVGPNGSGKSNISDAIRWVLGEMSARELRGQKMEDVIFNGAEGRRPLGYAEVSITFDNSDGYLPLAYTEVVITRRIDRAGQSEYFINRTPCRLRDIQELFLDTGIGKENYSVIGQGKIDEILLARPEERRALFEEAAGITRYKVRKREAARKLEETEQNLLRLGDLIGELEARLGDLAEQAEKTRRYNALAGELRDLEVGLLARALRQTAADLASAREQVAAGRARLQEVELRLQEAEQALEVARQLTGALEQEAGALQARAVEAAARYERAEGALRLHRQELSQVDGEAERGRREIGELEERLGRLGAQLAADRDRARAAAAGAREAAEELSRAEAEQQAARAALAEAEAALEEARAELYRLTEAARDRRSLAQAEGRARQEATERLAALEAEAQAAAAAAARAEGEWEAAQARLGDLARQQEAARAAVAAAREAEEVAAAQAAAAAERLARLRERAEAVASRLSLLEELKAGFEGFARGSRAVLQARDRGEPWARGVVGAVAEVIRTDPAYERAIEVALGGAIQNIITETEADAKACIEALKQTGAGRATFLPLSTIRPAALRPEEIRAAAQVPGYLGCALDLCRFDERLRPALAHLLGRVLVARDLDAALAMGRASDFRIRIVTLEGEVLAPGGAMTGGSLEGRAAGLLARERELEELKAERAALAADLAAARAELEAARAGQREAEAARTAREAELRELDLALAAARAEAQRLEGEVRRLREEARARQEAAAALAGRLAGDAAATQRLLAEAEELEARARAWEQEEIPRRFAAAQAARERAEAAAARVTAARVRCAELAQAERSLVEQVERLEAEVRELQEDLEHRRQAVEDLAARRAELLDRLAATEAELAAAARERDELRQRQEELQARRLSAREQVADREREIRALRRAQAEATAALSQAEVEAARLQAELDGLTQRLQEQHGLTPAEVAGRELDEALVPMARQRIQALKEAILELGPVNPSAIQEYEEARQRHQFLTQQRADLEEAKASLYRAIAELDRRIETHFLQAFRTIQREFQQVYQELFDGGRAELVLVDEQNLLETGVEIQVQPPGKKMTPLTLLSGGERAMTAIALLLALLRVRPSPFVVLDEVESALDEANVERVARYLKRWSEKTQFICITHQRGTMEVADALYGVTMEGTGVSRVVSVRLTEAQKMVG